MSPSGKSLDNGAVLGAAKGGAIIPGVSELTAVSGRAGFAQPVGGKRSSHAGVRPAPGGGSSTSRKHSLPQRGPLGVHGGGGSLPPAGSAFAAVAPSHTLSPNPHRLRERRIHIADGETEAQRWWLAKRCLSRQGTLDRRLQSWCPVPARQGGGRVGATRRAAPQTGAGGLPGLLTPV